MLLLWLLVAVMPQLTAACAPQATKHCDCGSVLDMLAVCYIKQAAPELFKCKCEGYYPLHHSLLPHPTSCRGVALPCRADEACPGGRYSLCACLQGGGNCRGYGHSSWQPIPKECNVNHVNGTSSPRRYSSSNAPVCECQWYNRGCHIATAAPEGFRCWCSITKGLFGYRCHGLAIGCEQDEYCPANDHTYCGCKRAGGQSNCNGYPSEDRKQVCDVGKNCDCYSRSDFRSGLYTINDVLFDTDNITQSTPEPVEIGHVMDLPNASDADQSHRFQVVKTVANETSFQHSHGVNIEAGITFSTSIPLSLGVTQQKQWIFGNKTTKTRKISHWFSCKSAPRTHTRCTVFVMRMSKSAPYTMLLKHNSVPNCECRSYGTYTFTESYLSTKITEQLGPCDRLNEDRECVSP